MTPFHLHGRDPSQVEMGGEEKGEISSNDPGLRRGRSDDGASKMESSRRSKWKSSRLKSIRPFQLFRVSQAVFRDSRPR